MDTPTDAAAPTKKPRKPRTPRTPAQQQAHMERQRIRRSKALVKEAATLGEVERKCSGTSKVRDENRQEILGPDGKALRKPCENPPIKGGTVCRFHGGNLPAVKAAAQRRLLALVMPSLVRLNDLIHQDTHLATSLGAIRTVLERAGGDVFGPLTKPTDDKDTRPIIQIGIKVGGIAQPTVVVGMQAKESLPAADDDVAEGEVIGDDDIDG